MREIKFRAWTNSRYFYFDFSKKHVHRFIGKNYVFEQYTGLKDKNGKEIFEGDIIAVNGKYPKIIEYSDKDFGFVMINISDLKNAEWMEIKQSPSACWFNDFKREIEIIGNIHENKDLLK